MESEQLTPKTGNMDSGRAMDCDDGIDPSSKQPNSNVEKSHRTKPKIDITKSKHAEDCTDNVKPSSDMPSTKK